MFTNIKTLPLLLVMILTVGPVLGQQPSNPLPAAPSKLVAPATGQIPVAFVVTEDAVMIDFAGPWEVFQDVMLPSRGASMTDRHVFKLYTVSDNRKPIRVSGGMQIIPDYTFDDAPQPKVVVVPAQSGDSPKMMEWIRKMVTKSDVVMSVCTGAFTLGEAGVLDGKNATTHHEGYKRFEKQFSRVTIQRDMRYVQSDPVIFTSGGLSAGIDLTLHIVELYFGRSVAERTARHMEYEGMGWMGDGTSSVKYSASTRTPNPSDGLTSGVDGNWQGKITIKEGSFQLVVHIWPDKNGVRTGTVDSVDEDVNAIAIDSITRNNSNLHFEVGTVGGVFDGKLNAKESAIEGTWTQHGATTPLVLTRLSH